MNTYNFETPYNFNFEHQLLDTLYHEDIEIELITDANTPPTLIDDLSTDNENMPLEIYLITFTEVSELTMQNTPPEKKIYMKEYNNINNSEYQLDDTLLEEFGRDTPSPSESGSYNQPTDDAMTNIIKHSLNSDGNNTGDIPSPEYSNTEWYVGAQNINEFKEHMKQTVLFNLIDQEDVNVLILTETNIMEEQIKLASRIQKQYDIFSSK